MSTLPNRDRTSRGRVSRALRRAAVEAVEQRVLLSATLQYQPVDDAGNLGAPVTSQWVDGTSVEDYTPLQKSLMTQGFAAPKVNLFLQVAGIEGESTDPLHKGSIELQSFSWGSDAQIGSGGAGAGKVSYQDLHFTAHASKASPKLLQDVATGTPIPQVDLFVRSKGNTPFEFLQIELQNVLVSSYQLQGHPGGALAPGGPIEEFSLNFAKVEFKYNPKNEDGSVAPPIVFGSLPLIDVQSFVPAETSLLDSGNSPVTASGNDFLQLDGLPGESADSKHKDWIDILSFSWGVSQTSSTGGGGAGKVNFQELHVTSRMSSASPMLMAHLETGRPIATGTVTERKSANDLTDYFQINLQDVLVSSYQLRTDSAGLVEEYTLAFGGVRLQYSPQNPDGTFDTPVVFGSGGATPLTVQDHAPAQRSVIDAGVVDPQSVDFFLQVDGVEGASADPQYKDFIDVLSFSWGADAVRGVPGTAGVTSFDELHVVTRASTATATLLGNLSTGATLPTATLIARHNDAALLPFLRFDLTGILVSSYHTTTAADGTLLEEYTLNFGQVKEQYTPTAIPGTPNFPVVFDSGPGALVPAVKPPEPSLLTDNSGGVPLSSAFDAFLEIDGIPGESADSKHKGEIDIESFSWGATQSGSGGGGGSGKVNYQDLHFMSSISKASPLLMKALTTGQHIPSATLVVRKQGVDPVEFYQIRLEDVLVSSYQARPGGFGGDHLAEEFTLNFARAVEAIHSTDGSTRDQSFQTVPTADLSRFAPAQQSLLQDGYQTMGAAVDAFLAVDGVDGESTNADHKGEIEIASWSWGATQSAATSTGGHDAGKVSMQDLHFVSNVSKATPQLLNFCCNGKHIPKVKLAMVRAGATGSPFLTITLEDVLVSSYQTVQFGDGSVRVEFTLSAARATEQYTPQDVTDPSVSFTTPQGIESQPFAAPQASPLDLGHITSGSSDLFLDVAGVDGGSTDDKHKGEIEIESFSWGATQTPSPTGGKASFQDLHFVAHTGKASAILIGLLTAGKHIPQALLTVRKAGGTQPEYLKISLEDVLVSSYQLTSAPDGTPLEEFTLHFSQFSPPTLLSTTIGDGTAQRSEVRSFSLSFDRPVAMGDGSVRLALLNSGGSGKNDNSPPTDISSVLAAPTSADGGTTWKFTFVAGTPFARDGSLVDGIYTLSVDPSKVTSNGLAMIAPASFTFHRLLSDIDGDDSIGPGDFNILATHFGQSGQSASTGDLNGDGVVGPEDFNLLATRFGTRLIMPPALVLSSVQSPTAAITQSPPAKLKVALPTASRVTARPRTIVKHR